MCVLVSACVRLMYESLCSNAAGKWKAIANCCITQQSSLRPGLGLTQDIMEKGIAMGGRSAVDGLA